MSSLSHTQASHLARRAGFSAQDSIVQTLLSTSSADSAVDALISMPTTLSPLPDWHDSAPFGRSEDESQRQENKQMRNQWSRELKYWWFGQMIANTSPLQEKMTLFWANHFTSSLKKVKWPPALLNQNRLLRTFALGSFRDMLKGILRDPAMLVYLDNANSNKGSPNENLARELLELFTMGEGQYSEQDIKELARALTGASVNKKTGSYRFNRRAHDSGTKTIFGQTRAFTPDDIADLILAQPQVAPFITEKLWRFFVDDTPDMTVIDSIALQFIQQDYDIATALKALFTNEAFWVSQGVMLKSPMELIVGSVQLFDLPVISQRRFLSVSRALGQDLFNPPHVKGWAEGRAWYTTGTLATREKVSQFVAARHRIVPAEQQLLAVPTIVPLPQSTHRNYLNLLVNDPAYQVT